MYLTPERVGSGGKTGVGTNTVFIHEKGQKVQDGYCRHDSPKLGVYTC